MEPIEISCWEEGRSKHNGQTPPYSLWDLAWDTSLSRPDIASSPRLADIKVFAVQLHAQKDHVGPVPQYAPLFSQIIGGLMGQERVAYIAADAGVWLPLQISESTGVIYAQDNLVSLLVPRELIPRRLWHFTLVKPKQAWFPGVARRVFIECPQEWIQYYFQEYLCTIGTSEFEGYILSRSSIPPLMEWNLCARDAALFDTVMDAVDAVFRTFADNDGLLVLTRKPSFEDFKRSIRLDDLLQSADSMSTEEQRPFWQMLGKLDRSAYNQRLERLEDLRAELETSLNEIDPHDPRWVQRFREAWSRLEQAYRTPLSIQAYPPVQPQGQTRSVDTLDLSLIFEPLDEVRRMVRSRLPALSDNS